MGPALPISEADCLEIFCGQFLPKDGVRELARLVAAGAGGANTPVPAGNFEGQRTILA